MEGRRGHLERTSSTVLWKRPASQRCGWLQGADPKAQQDLRRQVRRRLERDGRIPIPQAIQIALDVAGALDYAHRRWSVIHRDIKPENILLSDHHALVNDFGIAHAVCAARGDTLKRPSVTVGTPGYMSPEQAVGVGSRFG